MKSTKQTSDLFDENQSFQVIKEMNRERIVCWMLPAEMVHC